MPPEAGRGLGTEHRAHICWAGLAMWVLAEMSRLLTAVPKRLASGLGGHPSQEVGASAELAMKQEEGCRGRAGCGAFSRSEGQSCQPEEGGLVSRATEGTLGKTGSRLWRNLLLSTGVPTPPW